MEAPRFDIGVPRHVARRVLGSLCEPFQWNGLSCLCNGEVAELALPGSDWVRIETRYSGIRDSNWSLIDLRDSPYPSPFASHQFSMGHEVSGSIIQAVLSFD